jgi:8-amino-7-oxononanoate synthase
VLDFASALYLGMRHEHSELRPWRQFTTGVPMALAIPALAREVARELADMQGCEQATLATSTLHAFWDLFVMMAGKESAIFVDAGTYPIALWGVERAAARGVPVHQFDHHDPESLRGLLQDVCCPRALIVLEGFCPGCGRGAPLREFLAIAREWDAWLILDDTQALGIFGNSAGPTAPYGKGGGGMLQRANIGGPEVLVVSSLAKGFGVPLAVVAGSGELVERFERQSETRIHCSPPSIATLHAAEHALWLNHERGDRIRLRLSQLVNEFRSRLKQAGLSALGGIFPVQSLRFPNEAEAVRIHDRLLRSGIRSVLHRSRHDLDLRLSFLITARHTFAEIAQATDQLRAVTPFRLRSAQAR